MTNKRRPGAVKLPPGATPPPPHEPKPMSQSDVIAVGILKAALVLAFLFGTIAFVVWSFASM